MNEWVTCRRCKYWFEPDNDKRNYKVIQYKDAIIGVLCPRCSGFVEKKKEETA